MIKITSLADWIDNYAASHDISDATTAYYRRTIGVAEKWAGQPLTSGSLSDRLVNDTLQRVLKDGRSAEYVRSIKSAVAAIWRDMAEAGLCEPPRQLRRIRASRIKVVVWQPDDITRLIGAADRLQGCFRTMSLARAPYFSTLIRAAWDTGLRRQDLQRLRLGDVSQSWVDEQQKTRKPIRCSLRPSTLDSIRLWRQDRNAVLWPLWGSDESFRSTFRRLVSDAGITPGPFKTIRKSAGTAAEIACKGAGHLLLGNTRAVFERHYLDVVQIEPPRPPEIG